MTQQQNLEQHTVVIVHKDVNSKNSEADSPNENTESDIVCNEEIQNVDNGFMNLSPSSLDTSDTTTNLPGSMDEKKKFVTMCIETIKRNELPENFEFWTVTEQYNHLINNSSKYFPNIPESLRYVLPAIFQDGDCGRPTTDRPDWLDMDKFRKGQKFAQRNFTGISLAGLMSLLQLFTFGDGLKPLIFSRKSHTPYHAFKRYLSTLCRVKNWYYEDLWTESSPAYRDIQIVRKLHLSMRQKLCNTEDRKIDLSSEIPNSWCPSLTTVQMDFKETCPFSKSLHCPYVMSRVKNINQGEMSGTQFAFMGLVIVYPEKFGIHNAKDEDLEAFCHVWRSIGYLLGVEDKYNFCRGSLRDVQERTKDFIEYWVKPQFLHASAEWEHMSRCIFEGISYFNPPIPYKVVLLCLCDMLKLNMPRLYKSFSLLETLWYKFHNFIFGYVVKLPGIVSIMNITVHICMNRAVGFGPEIHSKLKKRSCKVLSNLTLLE